MMMVDEEIDKAMADAESRAIDLLAAAIAGDEWRAFWMRPCYRDQARPVLAKLKAILAESRHGTTPTTGEGDER